MCCIQYVGDQLIGAITVLNWLHLGNPAEAVEADFVITSLASDFEIQTDTNGEREESADLINVLQTVERNH